MKINRAAAMAVLNCRDISITLAQDMVESSWRPQAGRPSAGVRVLDLTRILAWPVGTRFLAGYGADVLRIDPPGWDEPSVAPDATLGKRCARLDAYGWSGPWATPAWLRQPGADEQRHCLCGHDVP